MFSSTRPNITSLVCLPSLALALTLAATACTDPGGDESGVADGESGESGEVGESGEGETEGGVEQLVTWHQDIAPVMAEKCGGCHRDGGIAPFSLETYELAAPWAELSLHAIESGLMPPWSQDNTDECQPRHGFRDDPRLTMDERAQLQAWIDDGKPEGDPASAAPLPSSISLTLDDADMRLTAGPLVLEPGQDQFWCYVIDPGFEQNTMIDATQIVAGNESIVHHVLLYIDETGTAEAKADENGRYPCFGGPGLSQPTLVSAWAPGVPPSTTPKEVAMMIPAGAKLVMNVHYHPTGDTQTDPGTSVDLRFATGGFQYLGQLLLMGNFSGPIGGGMGLQPGPNDSTGSPEFRIPAGAVGHTETMLFRLPAGSPDLKLWSAGTHMHYVGTDMLLGLQRAEPEAGTGIETECLLHTPRYDFNWQRGYQYDAPFNDLPTAKSGDVLYMRCNYDNSMGNKHVAAALAEEGLDGPVDVFLGEETLDEMCLGVYGIAYSLLP